MWGGVLGGRPPCVTPHPSPPHAAGSNPCSVNNGDCSQLCLPTSETSRSCMCTAGYSLKSGQQSCEGECRCAPRVWGSTGAQRRVDGAMGSGVVVVVVALWPPRSLRSPSPAAVNGLSRLLPNLCPVCHRHPWRKDSPPPWCSVPAPLKGCLCARCSVLLAGVTAPSGSGQGWNNNTALAAAQRSVPALSWRWGGGGGCVCLSRAHNGVGAP